MVVVLILVFKSANSDNVLFYGSVAEGTVTVSSSATTKVVTGFRPRYVMLINASVTTTSSPFRVVTSVYCSANGECAFTGARSANGTSMTRDIFPASAGGLRSIDDDGFTITAASTSVYGTQFNYVAVR